MTYSLEKHKLIQDYAWTLWESTFDLDTNYNHKEEKRYKVYDTSPDISSVNIFGLHHILIIQLCKYAVEIESDNPLYAEYLALSQTL